MCKSDGSFGYAQDDSVVLKSFLYHTAIVDFETKNVPVNVPVNPTEQTVLEEIIKNPAATYDEISLAIGKTRKTVSRAISSLKQRGDIRREGSDKSGIWVVN